MARYGKSSHRKGIKKGRVNKSQRRFVERIEKFTGRTFTELANLARLPYKPPQIGQLRFEEADMLVQYCYANIDDLVKKEYWNYSKKGWIMGNFFKKLAILNVIHKDRKGLEYWDIARELAILDEELIKQLVIELYEKHYIVTATQGWRLTGATDMYIELVLKPIVVPVVVSIMTATIMIVLFG